MPEHRSAEPPPERPADQDPRRPTNRFALASMLLGLLAVVLTISVCFCPLTWAFTPVGWVVAPIAAVLAVVFGFIGRGQFEFGDPAAGFRMASSGIIMGGVIIVLSLVMLLGAYLGWGLWATQNGEDPPPQRDSAEQQSE